MGWLIALGVLTLLAILPLGVRIRYDSSGFFAGVIAGPLGLPLFPRRKKKKKPKQKPDAPKAMAEKKKPAASQEKLKQGGSLTDFLPLVRLALDFLGDFRRKLRINRLEMKLILAGDDPCDLAVNYGRAWSALGNVMPQLERLFVIRKRDLQVECDFTADHTSIFAFRELNITLGRLISLGVWYGIRAVRELMIIQKKRKGGVVK